MIADHPLIGVGIGNYQVLYQQYSRPLGIDPRTTPRLAHNLYLETAAETGLAGLTPFVLFLTVVFAALRDAYRRMRPGEAPLAYTCGAAILAYMISALFLSHYIATSLPFWVLCAIALALPGIIDQPRGVRS